MKISATQAKNISAGMWIFEKDGYGFLVKQSEKPEMSKMVHFTLEDGAWGGIKKYTCPENALILTGIPGEHELTEKGEV